jgi:light-regulated signal transduction histidine kinase (bacteriophytochrome)
MMKLVDDLLIFSRLSHESTEYEQVDLNNIVEDIKKDLEVFIMEKIATITYPKLPYVYAVNGQIRQLFQNLISNALKFSKPETPPVVEIMSHEIVEKEKKRYVRLTFKDNGIGFNQEYADKIFVIFQRLHTKAEFAGTGIGLAIVKKIVDIHNGKILAYGQPGEGAKFEVHLPVS